MPTPSTKQETTLKQLRALAPTRRLTRTDCYRIAELQAARLRRFEEEAAYPTEAITELPRIQVRYETNLPSSGMTFWNGQRWIIVLDESEPTTRQRFSLLHEFKHILDHPSRYRSTLTHEQNEQLADYFAACVLMPKSKIKWVYGSGIQRLDKLARHFNVSKPAMKYRLDQLGLTERTQRCSTPFAATAVISRSIRKGTNA